MFNQLNYVPLSHKHFLLMPLTRVGVLSGNEVSTYQSNTANARLEFTQENFVKVVLENVRLHKELTETLKAILALEKETVARNGDLLKDYDYSPHLKIA